MTLQKQFRSFHIHIFIRNYSQNGSLEDNLTEYQHPCIGMLISSGAGVYESEPRYVFV
jgi:hypothetical protein